MYYVYRRKFGDRGEDLAIVFSCAMLLGHKRLSPFELPMEGSTLADANRDLIGVTASMGSGVMTIKYLEVV